MFKKGKKNGGSEEREGGGMGRMHVVMMYGILQFVPCSDSEQSSEEAMMVERT